MTDNELLINRLKNFIDYKKISEREFERVCDIGQSTISTAKKNKGAIGSDKLMKIHNKFSELNIDWLLTGEGEMLLNDKYSNKDSYLAEPINLYEPKLKEVVSENVFSIPIVGRASAGIIVGYGRDNERAYIEMCGLPAYMEHTARAFTVFGDSMQPILHTHDNVVCIRVIDTQNHSFNRENVYVIISVDGIYIKHVQRQKEGLLLVSQNTKYAPFSVDYTEILEVWHARKRILDI